MAIFRRTKTNDVIFLVPVTGLEEKSGNGKIKMLCCDSAGNVFTVLTDKSIYKIILNDIKEMEDQDRLYATVGFEICPGTYAPMVVEISSEDSWALSHALDHAFKGGVIPEVLVRHLQRIIKSGQDTDTGYVKDSNNKPDNHKNVMPRVLDRLPYYLEKDMEFSMPIYKAEHKYPLIVIKRLGTSEKAKNNGQRLLILDNDGDLAVIKIPTILLAKAEERLEEWARRSNRYACVLINRESGGYSISYIVISQAQKKALDVMAVNYEETGAGDQTISVAAQRVLTMAKESIPEPVV